MAEKVNNHQVTNAVKTVAKAIANDPELYQAYQSNIAKAFTDEVDEEWNYAFRTINTDLMHKVANDAAKRFLNILIQGAGY